MREELDILDNKEHIFRIKQQIYENLSMHGIETVGDARTSRVAENESKSYGLSGDRFFRFSLKDANNNRYIQIFASSKLMFDKTKDVREFLWISTSIDGKKLRNFGEFVKNYKSCKSL